MIATLLLGQHPTPAEEHLARWIVFNVYRRVVDTLILEAQHDGSAPAADEEFYLYYWDERDGEDWSGWWVTPECVGCMRYCAHARGSDVATPDLVDTRGWKDGEGRLRLAVTLQADGRLRVAPTRGFAGRYSHDSALDFLGYYAGVDHSTHNHKGRQVYRRVAPLAEPGARPAVRAHAPCCSVM